MGLGAGYELGQDAEDFLAHADLLSSLISAIYIY